MFTAGERYKESDARPVQRHDARGHRRNLSNATVRLENIVRKRTEHCSCNNWSVRRVHCACGRCRCAWGRGYGHAVSKRGLAFFRRTGCPSALRRRRWTVKSHRKKSACPGLRFDTPVIPLIHWAPLRYLSKMFVDGRAQARGWPTQNFALALELVFSLYHMCIEYFLQENIARTQPSAHSALSNSCRIFGNGVEENFYSVCCKEDEPCLTRYNRLEILPLSRSVGTGSSAGKGGTSLGAPTRDRICQIAEY